MKDFRFVLKNLTPTKIACIVVAVIGVILMIAGNHRSDAVSIAGAAISLSSIVALNVIYYKRRRDE